MMMMMHNNKMFLVIVIAALFSVITAVHEDRKLAPKSSKSSKSRKSSKKGKSSKNNKKTKSPTVSPTESPTTSEPSFNPTTSPPTSSPTSSLNAMTDLIIFGDSLSDNGNADQYFPCDETYCGHRYSNGPLVVELFSDALGLGPVLPGTKPDPTNSSKPIASGDGIGNNYAFFSASANTDRTYVFNNDKNNFAAQVGYYVENLEAKQVRSIEATALHWIYFGGNDVRGALSAPDPAASVAASVAAMIQNIQFLANMGACSFLVGGPPNVGKAPAVVLAGLVTPSTLLSRAYTEALETSLEFISITNTDPKCVGVQFFDLFAITNELVESEEFKVEFPDQEAYCNSRFVVPCDACNAVLMKVGLQPIPVNPNGIPCNCPLPILPEADTDFVCDGIPYYDELHPSLAFNKLVIPRLFAALAIDLETS